MKLAAILKRTKVSSPGTVAAWPSSSKRKAEKTVEAPESMLSQLQEFLTSPSFEKQFNGERKNGCFHPSELYKACRRRLAYEFLQAPTNPVNRDPRLQMIFEVGHGVHERVQKIARAMAERRGWTFDDEVKIRSTENHWYIGGSSDGRWIFDGGRQILGLEIKTINKDQFATLIREPKVEHIHQGNIYMGLLKMPRMAFWYICKDNSSMKEFIVEFNQSLFEQQMAEVEALLVDYLQQGKLPPKIKMDCNDPGCKYRDVCQKAKTGVKELANETTQTQISTFKAKFYGKSIKEVPEFRTYR